MAAKKEDTSIKRRDEQTDIAVPSLEEFGLGASMGFESLESSDLAISLPWATLLQPNSKVVAESRGKIPAGSFLLKIGDESFSYDSINVAIIDIGFDRTMWSENFKRGDSPLCRSFDGKKKVLDGAGDGDCATCQYAKFDTETRKTMCRRNYVILCQDLDNPERVFRIKASGASYKPTKEFIQRLNRAANKLNVPAFGFETILTSEFQTNDQGSFYTIVFDATQIKNNHLLYVPIDEDHPNGVDMDYLEGIKNLYQLYTENRAKVASEATLETGADGEYDDVL